MSGRVLLLSAVLLMSSSMMAHAETISFQQGVNGYSSTADTWIYQDPSGVDTNYGTDTALWTDYYPYYRQTLICFGNIFGNASGQVPIGSDITTATLTLTVFDPGTSYLPTPMLQSWDAGILTWNNALLGGNTQTGIQLDNVEAVPQIDDVVGAIGALNLDLTAIVQAWSDGQSNFGILMHGRSDNGMGMRSSEYETISERPLLTIEYSVPEPSSLCLLALGGLALIVWRKM